MNLFEGEIRFQVKKKANLTDVIRYAPPIDGAMIISSRLKKLLETFNIGKVHFKKVILIDTKGAVLSEDYFLIWIKVKLIGRIPFLASHALMVMDSIPTITLGTILTALKNTWSRIQ